MIKGVEPLAILKMHRADKTTHVEVIITVTLIAILRTVIIVDVKDLPSMKLVGNANVDR